MDFELDRIGHAESFKVSLGGAGAIVAMETCTFETKLAIVCAHVKNILTAALKTVAGAGCLEDMHIPAELDKAFTVKVGFETKNNQ